MFSEERSGIANLAAAALVLSQFVGQQPLSWSTAVGGLAAWTVLTTLGVLLLAGEE